MICWRCLARDIADLPEALTIGPWKAYRTAWRLGHPASVAWLYWKCWYIPRYCHPHQWGLPCPHGVAPRIAPDRTAPIGHSREGMTHGTPQTGSNGPRKETAMLDQERDELAGLCGFVFEDGVWWHEGRAWNDHPFPYGDLNPLAAVWPKCRRLEVQYRPGACPNMPWIATHTGMHEDEDHNSRFRATEYEARIRLTIAVLKAAKP